MRIDVSGLKKAVVLLLVALACDIAATAPACTCLQFCSCLHLSAVLLLLALVCSVAATCTCMQTCCYLLLLVLVCSSAAACNVLQFCCCLHSSAVLLLPLLLAFVCTTCTCLQFCCCLQWSADLLLLALICTFAGVQHGQRLTGTHMFTGPLLLHTLIKAAEVKRCIMAKLLRQAHLLLIAAVNNCKA